MRRWAHRASPTHDALTRTRAAAVADKPFHIRYIRQCQALIYETEHGVPAPNP
jgi:hypothetical protein